MLFLILPNPCSDFSDTKFEFHTEGLVKQKRWNALDGQKRLFLVVFEPFQVPSNAGLAPFSLQKKGSKNGQCGVKTHTSWPISTVFWLRESKKYINFHVTIRSVVRDLAYPIFCPYSSHRPWTKTSGTPKTWFCNRKVLFWYCQTVVVISVTSNSNFTLQRVQCYSTTPRVC